MTGTKVSDIREWLTERKSNHTHMIVVCDTFEHDNYPVFVSNDEDVYKIVKKYDGIEMQKVMEVYNLSIDLELQLNEHRVFNY